MGALCLDALNKLDCMMILKKMRRICIFLGKNGGGTAGLLGDFLVLLDYCWMTFGLHLGDFWITYG